MPLDRPAKYEAWYECSGCSDIVEDGSEVELVARVTGDELNNVDLTMLGMTTLSGTLHRPAGSDNATPITVRVHARAYTVGGFAFGSLFTSGVETDVELPAGTDSAPFELKLPDTYEYNLEYECLTGCDGLVEQSQYDSRSPDDWVFPGQRIVASTGTTGLNFSLLQADVFNALLSLPDGVVLSQDVQSSVRVEVIGTDNEVLQEYSSSVLLTAGESSTPVSLKMIPVGNGFGTPVKLRISYECYSTGCEQVERSRYFSNTGMVTEVGSADLLPLADVLSTVIELELAPISNDDFTLVNGTVSRPTGMSQDESIFVNVGLTILEDDGTFSRIGFYSGYDSPRPGFSQLSIYDS